MWIGTRIRQARCKSGMSIRQMAEKLNVSHATLGHWKTGTYTPSIPALLKIARITNSDFTWLATGHTQANLRELTDQEIEKIFGGVGSLELVNSVDFMSGFLCGHRLSIGFHHAA